MGYLSFWVTQNGIRTINNKLEVIVNMTPPKSQKQVCVFIVLVNYYRYIWNRWSHLLQPLTAITSNKVKFKCTNVEQKSFDDIKRIVVRNTLYHTQVSINYLISIWMLAIYIWEQLLARLGNQSLSTAVNLQDCKHGIQ